MSKLNRKKRAAVARGCYPYREGKAWDVYVKAEGPLGPRGLALTKRQAVSLAYAIAVSKRQEIVVTTGDAP